MARYRHGSSGVSRRWALGAGSSLAAFLLACGAKQTTTSKEDSKPQVGVSSAQTATAAEPAQPGGTLAFYEIGNPTFDAHTNARYWTMKAVGGVQSRLLRFKAGIADPKIAADRDVEPDLAQSVESTDGVTWVAKLRPDATFHNVPPVNGHAVEAEDIKSSWVRALTHPKNANRGSISMIDENQIETPDKNTVVFKLKSPYAPFRKVLASPTYAWIFPREAATNAYDPEKQVIGSGPFLFDGFTPDVAVSYKRNPAWFLPNRPFIEAIRHAIVPAAEQQLAQFTAGNLDIVAVDDTDLSTMKRNRPDATVITAPPGVPGWVFGQLGDKASVWADVRVRRAVSMAIDRDALAKVTAPQGGENQFVVGVSFGKWALKPAEAEPAIRQWYTFNVAEARKLLDAAGFRDFPFKFVYTNNGYGARFNTTAETLNGMLSAAGFKTTLVTIDYQREYVGGGKGVRYGSLAGDSMAYGLTSGFDEADEILFNYFHSRSGLRNTNISDPALDALIDKQRTLLNDTDRVKAIIDIERYIADQAYLVAGLPTPYAYTFVQPRVRDYAFTTSYGVFTESFANLWLKR